MFVFGFLLFFHYYYCHYFLTRSRFSTFCYFISVLVFVFLISLQHWMVICLNKSYFFQLMYIKFPLFKRSTIVLVTKLTAFLLVRTVRWNIQAWATDGTRRLTGDSSVSHRWRTPSVRVKSSSRSKSKWSNLLSFKRNNIRGFCS